MNLNEECLLQFLKNDRPNLSVPAAANDGSLASDLRRIYRRSYYVSFPQAILIRRPLHQD